MGTGWTCMHPMAKASEGFPSTTIVEDVCLPWNTIFQGHGVESEFPPSVPPSVPEVTEVTVLEVTEVTAIPTLPPGRVQVRLCASHDMISLCMHMASIYLWGPGELKKHLVTPSHSQNCIVEL